MKQSKELAAAIMAARAAGEILKRDFSKDFSVARKSASELVTSVDLECEKKIVSMLRKEFPDYGVLSEEAGSVEKESDFRWIIDPLDGTHNFVWGIPVFGVSIALEKAGAIQCGVILLPMVDELYAVEMGKGAFLNGKRIKVSSRRMEDAAINVCGYMWKHPELVDRAKELSQMVFNAKVLGSSCFAVAKVASGKLDATIELREKPWDFAAGWLLVEEAGGKITAMDGGKISFSETRYIASSGVFHDKLVKAMGGRV